MTPPIQDSILRNNPKFAALHKNLTTNILNPHGSTKTHPAQTERDSRAEALQTHCVQVTKSDILRTALTNLSLSQDLPHDLVELILLLSLQLSSSPLPSQSTSLLESTTVYASLPIHLPQICALLSNHLHSITLALARILNPHTNSSYLHRQIPNIHAALNDLQSSISAKRASLAISRAALVPRSTLLLSQYLLATEATITILEQTKHGAYSRSSRSRAEFLGLQAQIEAQNTKQLAINAANAIYPPEVREALRRYAEHLRDGRARLRARRRDAEAELARYGVGREEDEEEGPSKEKVMREIARVYREMAEEIEEVRRDIERLKAG